MVYLLSIFIIYALSKEENQKYKHDLIINNFFFVLFRRENKSQTHF